MLQPPSNATLNVGGRRWQVIFREQPGTRRRLFVLGRWRGYNVYACEVDRGLAIKALRRAIRARFPRKLAA